MMPAAANDPASQSLKADYDALQDRWTHSWTHGPTNAVKMSLVAKLFKGTHDKAVLDVGCGDGRYSAMLERSNRVVSVDLSPVATGRTNARRVQKDSCVVASFESLPFRDSSFDVLTALDVLEHVADDGQGVREVQRVLRSGGRMMFTMPEDMALFSRLDTESGHYRRYAAEQVHNELLACFDKEVLSDYGFPLMRIYLRLLAWWRIEHQQATGLIAGSTVARWLSLALALLFRLDRPFDGSFRGVQLYGVYRNP